MTQKTHLKKELRAVREEIARRELTTHRTQASSLLSPPIDIKYARLTELTDEHLENHKKRLERDLRDTNIKNPNELYRPTDTSNDNNDNMETE